MLFRSEMKQAIAALSPKREDRLLAVNRANWLYTMTGLHAPTRVFHPQHLMCPFPAAAGNPFAANMAQKPRFIVIAEGGGAMVCELKDAWRDVRAAIAANYVERARVRGHSEEQVLYERKT